MSAYQDEDEDGDYTDDDDWYDDDDDYREPDPEDAEIARSYEEYYEHCDQAHGGKDCDCHAPLADRIRDRFRSARRRVRTALGRTRYSDEPPF